MVAAAFFAPFGCKNASSLKIRHTPVPCLINFASLPCLALYRQRSTMLLLMPVTLTSCLIVAPFLRSSLIKLSLNS